MSVQTHEFEIASRGNNVVLNLTDRVASCVEGGDISTGNATVFVVGSTAVAHYYYSTAAEDREGERETTHGRYTDVLVKQDGRWMFIAWRGGDDPRLND